MNRKDRYTARDEWIATNHAPNRPYKVEREGRIQPALYWIGGIVGVMVLLWLAGAV